MKMASLLETLRSVGLTSIAHTFGMKPNDINLAKLTKCMERAQFDKSDEYHNKMAEIDTNFKLLSLNYINNLNLAWKKNLKDKFPLTTESAMKMIEEKNTFVFNVDQHATKHSIKLAIKKLYDIKTVKINTLNCISKNTEKAFVKLAANYDALNLANKIGII